MDVSISDEIRETTNLINLAGAWGLNEFLVFASLFGFVGFVFIFWLINKTANKNTERVIDLNIKTNEALNNNTLVVHTLTTIISNTSENNKKKLDDMHDDIKEIKTKISRKQKQSFSEHLKETDYE